MRTMRHSGITQLLRYSTTGVIALLVDRLIKALVRYIPPFGAEFYFVHVGFGRVMTTNIFGVVPIGTAFGLLLPALTLFVLFLFFLRGRAHLLTRFPLASGLIFLGGLSNVYDRVMFGAVTDVFRLGVGGSTLVFNIADGMIVYGMIRILITQQT